MTGVDLIIFGASGDLSARKLFPALFQLDRAELLPSDLRITAIARDQVDVNTFLEGLRQRMHAYMGSESPSADSYSSIRATLDDTRVSLFYLATPPSIFALICNNLAANNCLTGDCRIVLEKPIGECLASSKEVNETLARYFDEGSIYRIDHYLGKETVQNLLALRFANRFINSQWDANCIDHVQITVGEIVGIEGRWSYYDRVGQLRDMVQNHLMQLLCLVAMEPPNSLEADSIRDEKVKIVKALRRIDSDQVSEHVIKGQYSQGWSSGAAVPGYLEEPGCERPDSDTETFIAIKAHVDNWRWAGVPFYLRTGKRVPEKLTEIIIQYKDLPHNIFSGGTSANKLIIRLQPREGIELTMASKRQTLREKLSLQNHTLDLDFRETTGMNRIPDAYERLFLDAINGDQSLFVGREEIEESWRWCDELIDACNQKNIETKPYHAGSWGPPKAELLIEKDGRSWHV